MKRPKYSAMSTKLSTSKCDPDACSVRMVWGLGVPILGRIAALRMSVFLKRCNASEPRAIRLSRRQDVGKCFATGLCAVNPIVFCVSIASPHKYKGLGIEPS